MAGYAANSAVNTPQVTPERSMNNPGSYNNESYNSFDKSHLRFYTQRFSEVYPCFMQPAMSGDNIPLSVRHELRNYTLKAPLLSSLKMYRSFYQVPLSAISPYTWELQLRQPVRGQDIDYLQTAQNFDLLAFWNVLRQALSVLHSIPKANFTSQSLGLFVGYLLRIALTGNLVVGNSSLLSALGIAIPYRKEMDEFYSDVMDFIFARMTVTGEGSSPWILSLSYTDNDKNVHSLSAVRDPTDPSSFNLSFSEFWNFIRDSMQFSNIKVDGSPNISATDIETIYNAFYDLLFRYFNPGTNSGVFSSTQFEGFLASLSTHDDARYFSLRPVIAYQMACAQYFSNTAVDDVYTSKQWLSDTRSWVSGKINISSLGPDNPYPDAEFFSVNGCTYQYDEFATKRVTAFLSVFGKIESTGDLNGIFPSIYRYIENLFGIRQSLRYPDYFTSSRTQPLAVGDVTTTVNQNKVSAIDINQSLWFQRFLNAVNRTSQNIYEYLKSMDGVEPQRKSPQPYFLASEEFNISGQEVENTSNNQGAVTTLLRSENSNFAFKAFIDEPSYIIGVTYFNALSVYDSLRPLHWEQNERFDWFNPYMQHVGDQPVMLREIASDPLNPMQLFGDQFSEGVFGYQLRYAQYKFDNSIALGGFINGSLPGWSLICRPFGRAGSVIFSKSPTISEQFIRNDDYAFDELYSSLTGTNPATRFHFVIAQYADEVVNSKQQKFPSLL